MPNESGWNLKYLAPKTLPTTRNDNPTKQGYLSPDGPISGFYWLETSRIRSYLWCFGCFEELVRRVGEVWNMMCSKESLFGWHCLRRARGTWRERVSRATFVQSGMRKQARIGPSRKRFRFRTILDVA